jgi:hypothetical protein
MWAGTPETAVRAAGAGLGQRGQGQQGFSSALMPYIASISDMSAFRICQHFCQCKCRHILNVGVSSILRLNSHICCPYCPFLYIFKNIYILYRGYSTIRRQFVKQNLGQRHFLAVPKRRPAVPFGTAGAVWDGPVPHQRRTGYARIFRRIPASPGYACISQAAPPHPRESRGGRNRGERGALFVGA